MNSDDEFLNRAPIWADRRDEPESTVDKNRRIEKYIASLHLLPGQAIPGDWETCPVCDGEGCGDCDDCGRVHPVRVEWLEDMLARLCDAVFTLEERLHDTRLRQRARRAHEWWAAQSEAADELLRRWSVEDGDRPNDRWRRTPPCV